MVRPRVASHEVGHEVGIAERDGGVHRLPEARG